VFLRMKDDNDGAEPVRVASRRLSFALISSATTKDGGARKKTIDAFATHFRISPVPCRKCWWRSITR